MSPIPMTTATTPTTPTDHHQLTRYVLSDAGHHMASIGSTRANVMMTRSGPFALAFTTLPEAREWLAGLCDPRAPRLDVEAVPAWMLLGLAQRAG